MIVQTLERRFVVLQVLRRDERAEICVCQDTEDEDAGLYTLARFRDPALHRCLLPMLVRQRLNPAFEDYLVRQFAGEIARYNFKAKGSGKSGLIATSAPVPSL